MRKEQKTPFVSCLKWGGLLVLSATVAACGSSSKDKELDCDDGMLDCEGICVDTMNNVYNCGECGVNCADGEVCVNGNCELYCPGGLNECNGGCVNLQTDRANCGTCGNGCDAGEVCSAGSCELSCHAGLDECNGGCVNLQTDRANCGTCENACDAGEVCSAGSCALSCHAGLDECNGGCVNLQTDRANCGTCENACDAGEVCSAGSCALSCHAGLDECDGVCVDTENDPSNCGGCGEECEENEFCWGGDCTHECPGYLEMCDGVCVDTENDPANCGGCGDECGVDEFCDYGSCGQKAPGFVFLTGSNSSVGFYRYDPHSDDWSTVTAPPVTTYSQLTNDGRYVYLMGNNNQIYRYNPATDIWTAHVDGPGFMTGSAIGLFVWYASGFYYCNDGTNDLYNYRDGVWTSITLTVACSSAGTWDKHHKELYIRTWHQLGFQVINTTNNTIARTITDITVVGENSRSGSYLNGYFYDRDWSGPIQQFDGLTGNKTSTGLTPTSSHTGTDTDFRRGVIYFSGYSPTTAFQRFDPVANTLVTLSGHPSVDHSTITVMR